MHRNVVEIIDHFKAQGEKGLLGALRPATKYVIVMEYCLNGNLHTFLKASRTTQITFDKRLSWYRDLVSGLQYIHSQEDSA